MPEKQKFIALDVGNCCVSVSNDECIRKMGVSSIEDVPKNFLETCAALECGKVSERDWLCEFHKATGGKYSEQELVDAWLSIVRDEIPGMPEALKEITDSGCRVIFFSDTSELHILHAISKMELSVYVSGAIYSYEVGARKPSKKMFEAFEEKYGLPILYTDDKPENIAAGTARGWNSHLFTNAESFIREFRGIAQIQ